MRVLVTGGAGFLGRKLAARLLADGALGGAAIERLVVADVAPAQLPADPRLAIVTVDLASDRPLDALVADCDLVFHLAAVVSAGAEADFDLGYRVNLDGTRRLLEALRRTGRRPKLLFASSVAVFGGDPREPITDTTHLTPQTSYGTQKAAGELLVNDYARKGFIEGGSLRLPTIVVRAGRPNLAASTFASSIIREPLAGEEAICPVSPETAMYVLSPRRVIDAFIHAAGLPDAAWGWFRALTLPGITVRVRDMLEALERVAGPQVRARVRFSPDPRIQRIVDSWPPHFRVRRALELGFAADPDFDSIIRAHIEDELDGQIR
ncbi:UDP-glucose 4-epimerase [bacterium HR40]|nr:UDP-glucose 4-epimerase [bacterium HR40]